MFILMHQGIRKCVAKAVPEWLTPTWCVVAGRASWLAGLNILASWLLAGCIYTGNDRFISPEEPYPTQPAPRGTVNVHFLGTGGIFLQADGVSVLADPFFTNPYLWHLYSPFETSSDTGLIDERLGKLPGLQPLQAILVTHAHYDHAMDVPYIARQYHPSRIYGSNTLRNALDGVARESFCNLSELVNDPTQGEATWIDITPRVKIAAVRSGHFAHVGNFFYAKGEYEEPLPAPPSRLHQWRSGETYSFVIDIVSGQPPNETVFRVFYMPSAASHPTGTPPAAILEDGHQVDLAIVGVSQLEKDENYPGSLLERIQPAHVMLVHWENFFERNRFKRVLNFGVNPAEVARRITRAIDKQAPVYWPYRGTAINFPLHFPSAGTLTGHMPSPPGYNGEALCQLHVPDKT